MSDKDAAGKGGSSKPPAPDPKLIVTLKKERTGSSGEKR